MNAKFKPWILDKPQRTYAAFKQHFVGNKEKIEHTNYRKFLEKVVEETDKCISGRKNSAVSNMFAKRD